MSQNEPNREPDLLNLLKETGQLDPQPAAPAKASQPLLEAEAVQANYSADLLDHALGARPLSRAPRNTLARVMATIATVPQETPLAPYSPPAVVLVRYEPPKALPLPEPRDEEFQVMGQRITRLIFTSAWVGLCALLLYLVVWPLFSNVFLGAHNEIDLLRNSFQLVSDLVVSLGNFITAIAPLLPSIISALVGVAIMLVVFGTQRGRVRTE